MTGLIIIFLTFIVSHSNIILGIRTYTNTHAKLTSIPYIEPLYDAVNIQFNLITEFVTAELIHLTSLQYLYLGQNNISNISQVAFTGINYTLTELYIGSNKLTYIGDEFSFLGALKLLGLADNEIAAIDAHAFCAMESMTLSALYLNGNRLSKFPDLTCLRETLRVVNLGGNQLAYLHAEDVEQLIHLTNLTLMNNTFLFIEGSSFINMVSNIT